jgi:hypothetical protein
MKNLNAGSVIIVVALIILGFLSTLLTNIVPLTIVAIIAFILGRTSHTVNYMQIASNLLQRSTKQIQAATAAKTTTTTPKKTTVTPPTESVQTVETTAAPAHSQTRQKQAEENLADSDMEIKTEAEVLAEARLREEEIRKNSTVYDPTAALEERRRRLLGQNGEQQSGE